MSVISVTFCLLAVDVKLLSFHAPTRNPLQTLPRPWIAFRMFIAVLLVVLYVIFRNGPSVWFLQDILGIAVMVYMLQVVRISSFPVCFALLTVMLIYDVVMVFAVDVMVTVATQVSPTGESVPLLLRFPTLVSELGGYTMLGYGDVILPGLLIVNCRVFDLHIRDYRRSYFYASICGYVLGILLTIMAMAAMQRGQPALLYISPCILGAVAVAAACKKETRKLWEGFRGRAPKLPTAEEASAADEEAVRERGEPLEMTEAAAHTRSSEAEEDDSGVVTQTLQVIIPVHEDELEVAHDDDFEAGNDDRPLLPRSS